MRRPSGRRGSPVNFSLVYLLRTKNIYWNSKPTGEGRGSRKCQTTRLQPCWQANKPREVKVNVIECVTNRNQIMNRNKNSKTTKNRLRELAEQFFFALLSTAGDTYDSLWWPKYVVKNELSRSRLPPEGVCLQDHYQVSAEPSSFSRVLRSIGENSFVLYKRLARVYDFLIIIRHLAGRFNNRTNAFPSCFFAGFWEFVNLLLQQVIGDYIELFRGSVNWGKFAATSRGI